MRGPRGGARRQPARRCGWCGRSIASGAWCSTAWNRWGPPRPRRSSARSTYAADADAAFASSEGNPLFAIEIARAAAAGADTRDEPLDRLLDERLERLSEPARDLLPWAAALGRSFDPEVLALVRGSAATDLVEALDDLERHGVHPRDRGRRLRLRPRSAAPGGVPAPLAGAAPPGPPADRPRAARRARRRRHGRGRDRASRRPGRRRAAGRAERGHRRPSGCLRVFAYAEAAELASRGLQHLPRIERLTRIRLQIALSEVLVESGRTARTTASLEADLSRAIVEAQEAGLHNEAAQGFRARALLYYMGERFEAAQESSIRAVEAIRPTDAATRGRELAVSARCMMVLETEVPRAQAMIGEARALLGADAERLPHVAWAAALLARYTGDRATAAGAFDTAIDGFAREGAHWERFLAMAQKVMLELEHDHPEEARMQCGPLAEVAGKMSEGSEPAVAAALAALAERAVAGPGKPGRPGKPATAGLDDALRALVAADTKAMLAYTLNTAATQDLEAGDLAGAEQRAGAALAAAAVVGRRSGIAVARSLLGRAALARGDAAPREGPPRRAVGRSQERACNCRYGPRPPPTRWRRPSCRRRRPGRNRGDHDDGHQLEPRHDPLRLARVRPETRFPL